MSQPIQALTFNAEKPRTAEDAEGFPWIGFHFFFRSSCLAYLKALTPPDKSLRVC